ncbi:hypothetical protein M885DRAFT_458016 [Pelagophyceae sp. CCMP2097]|nr:hypothetical protein M885DRAFT_458016 [Pelagophyceae sp. CCMP2097]|mmetsp:Transcript_28633/g.98487  ORF Transcript_28633/g.98487 Transcript_28633/m.98487 type:complete len:315 (-) Transcript_28633:79-1023(-)
MAVPVCVVWMLAAPTLLWLATYFLPLLYVSLRGPQDLKKKYNATWALVTGGSTGIGRAICDELASQGLNIVIAALPDAFLDPAVAELSKQYASQQFLAVPVSFAPGQPYLAAIMAATADKDVQIIFNNAGFIVTGFFDTQPLGKHAANLECNATAAMAITHHFAAAMLRKKLKGCIVFTSSASAYIPNPFAIVYGATKAFMSQFAASIAVELQCKGIDVCVVHPSPVASNFYEKVEHKIESMEAFKKVAVQPSALPKAITSAVGRVVLLDVGATAMGMRLFVALVPYNFLASLIAFLAPILPDYVTHDKKRGLV